MLRRTLLKFIYQHKHKNLVAYGQLLKQWEQFSLADSKQLQMKHLNELLLHAVEHVPYYKNLFSKNLWDKDGLINMDAFKQLPVLEKSSLNQSFEQLKSNGSDRQTWKHNATGGSTGEPARFMQDINYAEWNAATKMFYDGWTGYELGCKKVVIWGAERDIKGGLLKKFRQYLYNKMIINAYQLKSEEMLSYVRGLNRAKPTQVLGYASCLYDFARYIDQKKLTIYSPKAIMSSAEVLYPHMRELIERVFQAPVFNRYGSREMGDMACECTQHNGLHISMPTHYVEVIREDGKEALPGEMGHIVVTGLTNYAMPLIRYRTGDLGMWAENSCDCGCAWPLLQSIVGRAPDALSTAKGDRVHAYYFNQLFFVESEQIWIKKFQVVQEDYDQIYIYVTFHPEDKSTLADYAERTNAINVRIRKVMGEQCQISWVKVDEIPPAPSGKHCYVYSKVGVEALSA